MRLGRRTVLAGGAALAAMPRTLPAAPRSEPRLRSGLDRVLSEGLDQLRGQRIAMLTHDAAVTAAGQRGVDAIAAVPGLTLATLFAPEHGLSGAAAAGAKVADLRDGRTGLPVFSLYGARRAPEPAHLAGIDLLLIDLQDVGLRCYTYIGTALAAMEAAAAAGVRVLILDRPNPLGGIAIEGPLVDDDKAFTTPVTAVPVPYRHGWTLGEVTRWLTQSGFGGRIAVSKLDGWRRDMGTAIYAPGALPFAAPSPNLRSPAAILAYAATVLLEGTNLSEGRGSDAPFEQFGAPWVNAAALAKAMARARLPGVRFNPVSFLPAASKHSGVLCHGLRLTVTDEARFNGFATGTHLIAQLRQLHPESFAFLPGTPPFFDLLAGRSWVRTALEEGVPGPAIASRADAEVSRWRTQSAMSRLY